MFTFETDWGMHFISVGFSIACENPVVRGDHEAWRESDKGLCLVSHDDDEVLLNVLRCQLTY